jgi:DNA-binding response OmpR family regulator
MQQNQELILVVEDEPTIAEAIASRLTSEGYQVAVATDGPSAVEQCGSLAPDLVVLDLNLPGFDGIEVCRRIHTYRRVPVVMLTARDDETDMLIGLGVGADDYMTKPFSPRELLARVKAVLRRAQSAGGGSGPTLSFPAATGEIEIDPTTRRVTDQGQEVHLTPTEFDLLRALAEAGGAVLSREQLLAMVWGYRDGSGARTVDSHIRSVRAKLSVDLIRTVHGVGYALDKTPAQQS